VPASTNFARIDDLDAVPVREDGKARFRHYLTLPSPNLTVSIKSWHYTHLFIRRMRNDGCKRTV